ncbi:MAG: type II toxin-antitoxin system HipA family toxin [Gammaproteobacteria bacterium]
MTSKPGQTECFVYIALPGQAELVTAGRFRLEIDHAGGAVGRFRYGRSYLARPDSVPLDPVELTLLPRTYTTARMKGVFGALRDASPDYWGRRVIDRHARTTALSEIDYLLHAPDDRAGALAFGLGQQPPAPRRDFNKTLQLERLQELADAIINEEAIPQSASADQIDALLLVGTSMGGARPKTVIEHDDALWLAKFNHPEDRWNFARVEHAMLALGRECGLSTALSQVVDVAGRDVLLVRRFDREKTDAGYTRARMISGLTLLQCEDTLSSRERWSYPLLAEELRRVSAAAKHDAQELFRRMCFNAMISNTDDHPRNHAVIAKETAWRLSPAYDLTPATPVSIAHRDLAMACGDDGRFANARNLLSQAPRFLLKPAEASAVLAAMQECVQARWYATARACGVTETDCEKISPAFLYDGFSHEEQ